MTKTLWVFSSFGELVAKRTRQGWFETALLPPDINIIIITQQKVHVYKTSRNNNR